MKKLLCLTLAITMVIVGLVLPLGTFSAAAYDAYYNPPNPNRLPVYTPSSGVSTFNINFAMPGAWMGAAGSAARATWEKYGSTAGIYWWGSKDNPDEARVAEGHGFPGWKMKWSTDALNLYTSLVPRGTASMIFSNFIDGGMDNSYPEYNAAQQTMDLTMLEYLGQGDSDYYPLEFWDYLYDNYYDAFENNPNYRIPEFGDYAKNFFYEPDDESIYHYIDDMVFVVDTVNTDKATVSPATGKAGLAGAFYFYYGNGEFGIWPTKELCIEKEGLKVDGKGNVLIAQETVQDKTNFVVRKHTDAYGGSTKRDFVVFGNFTNDKYLGGSSSNPGKLPAPLLYVDGYGSSATVSWSTVNNAAHYILYYKKASDANWSSKVVYNGGSSTFSSAKNEVYYFQIQAVSSSGEKGTFSSVKSFTFNPSSPATIGLPEYTPSHGVSTNNVYFAMPGLWKSDFWKNRGSSAGIYWWSSEDNPDEYPYAKGHGWPGWKMKKGDKANLYTSLVPKGTANMIFNNFIDSGMDKSYPEYNASQQTKDLTCLEYQMQGDSDYYPLEFWDYLYNNYEYEFYRNPNYKIPEFGNYAKNFFYEPDDGNICHYIDDMVFVVDIVNIDRATVSPVSGKAGFDGAFYFYYGNGEFGIWPTKAMCIEKEGLKVDGNGNVLTSSERIDPNNGFVLRNHTDAYDCATKRDFVVFGNFTNDKYMNNKFLAPSLYVDGYGNSATVSWSTVYGAANYILYYKKASDAKWSSKIVYNGGSTTFSSAKNEVYYFQIQAVSSSGEKSTYSAVKSYTFNQAIPAPTASIPNYSTNNIYFYANPDIWKNYNNICAYIYDNDGDELIYWGSNKGKMTNVGNGYWAFDFGKAGITLSGGKQYGVIFTADWGAQSQSCDLIFDRQNLGDVAYLNGNRVENNIDSNNKSYVVKWKSGHNGIPVCITTIGNVIGDTYWQGDSAYSIFRTFLISNGANGLRNVIRYNGKTEQQTIDDTAKALGLTLDQIKSAINSTGRSFNWSAEKSPLYSKPTVKLSSKSNGIRAEWNSVPGATKYIVYYRKASSSTWSSVQTTNNYYPLLNLTPGTNYAVQVLPILGSKNGTYSSVAQLVYVPQVKPTLKLSNKSNGIRAEWNTIAGASKYIVYYRKASSSTWSSVETKNNYYPLLNLSAGTNYAVQVQPVFGSSKGMYSSVAQLAYAPQVKPTVKLSNKSNGIRAEWNKFAAATKYIVYYRKASSSTWTSVQTTDTYYPLLGLAAGTNYVVQVQPVFVSAKGMYSTSVQLVYIPQVKPTLKLSKKSNGIRAEWNKFAAATKYIVYYKKTTDSKWSVAETKNTYYPLLNLKRGATYAVQVQPVFGNAKGLYSTASTMTY